MSAESSDKQQDESRLPVVPSDFQEEVTRALNQEEPRNQWGDLKLLQKELHGFPWEVEGLRLVGRAQFSKRAYKDARDTWEAIREYDPNDKEANTWLGTIYQKVSNLTESIPTPDGGEGQTEEPPHVLLFTGHRIDSPGREKPRFPANKEGVARAAIKDAVEKEVKRVVGQVIGIAGAASGGDIIFHEVCAELNIPATLYLAMPRDEYVKGSVRDAGPEWVDRFDQLRARLPKRELGKSKDLPRWLQSKPDYGIWARNNLWMLYNAMACGSRYTTLILLWDGATGDGPGGTEDMFNKAEEEGAKTIILNTEYLFGL